MRVVPVVSFDWNDMIPNGARCWLSFAPCGSGKCREFQGS